MEQARVSLRTAIAMCLAVGLVFMAGVFAAHAWPGRSGVEVRSFFTLAGNLNGVPAGELRSLRLTFHKRGGGDCSVTASGDNLHYNSPNFSAQVDYEACGRGYFDGSDLSFDVAVNDTAIVGPDGGFQVSPVPYAQFASVAGAVGTPECPMGYERAADRNAPSGAIVCQKLLGGSGADARYDETVRVGSGASAFWIDRYEAATYNDAHATRLLSPGADGPLPSEFPSNGEWTGTAGNNVAPLVYAWSIPLRGASPMVSWFQAREACRASGKRLPSNEEWSTAASGTIDPGESSGGDLTCNTTLGRAIIPNPTSRCRSRWGAVDMIGNLWEWVADWQMGVGTNPSISADPWGPDGGADRVYGVISHAVRDEMNGDVAGLPSAILRGGGYGEGVGSGVFTLTAANGPTVRSFGIGFRCIIPR